jgi:hypothetical protein
VVERGGASAPVPFADPAAFASMRRYLPIVIAAVYSVLSVQMAAAPQDPVPVPDAAVRSAVTSPVVLPASFHSDGCTWWFDGDHKACCVQHDIDYYLSTTWRDRRRADRTFCACIWRTPGWWHKPLAPVMWAGMHVLHHGIRPLLGALHLWRPSR